MKTNSTHILFAALVWLLSLGVGVAQERIDRRSVVERNCPVVHAMDTLSSLTVGNGNYAFTVDATGLQTFPLYYANGICLGTQSSWGWHSFPNTAGLRHDETLRAYNFGHRSDAELYSCQSREPGRMHDASEYYRINPHRLHLGTLGFDFGDGVTPLDVDGIDQRLDAWRGEVSSRFSVRGQAYAVSTVCHPDIDAIAVDIASQSHRAVAPIVLSLPYPTGGHVDGACDWQSDDRHTSSVVRSDAHGATVCHRLDTTTYYVTLSWQGRADFRHTGTHRYCIVPKDSRISVTAHFSQRMPQGSEPSYAEVKEAAERHWAAFWTQGAAVDFSRCTDPRAAELERRVVLSQYLLACQCAGDTPPQETGLTMNSWYGKFHLEMILWHQAWLPLWGHEPLLQRSLEWYRRAMPVARQIAERQGFEGVRWMKMTDPDAIEAPSNVGSFLIWQQPHLIYLAELARRSVSDPVERQQWVERMYPLVDATAQFMQSFATFDPTSRRYMLKGYIPAQETLKADVTFNSPFELSQWHYTLEVAQLWRTLVGQQRDALCDSIIRSMSPLAHNADSLYLAAESATDTYTNERMTSDHPALLGALGFFPECQQIDRGVMLNTLNWIVRHWNWPTAWGWDFPMAAMTATRLHQPDKAVDALLLGVQKNTYLNNGHNYQDKRLRLYLPGNGGLLSAVALMCAGWDGCTEPCPGFPKDGRWDVRWEGLKPMP